MQFQKKFKIIDLYRTGKMLKYYTYTTIMMLKQYHILRKGIQWVIINFT